MDWTAFDEACDAGLDASEIAACEARLDASAPRDYRALAARLAGAWIHERRRCVGLAGGQGAGKSTLGRLLVKACGHFGLRAQVVALDDFYLSREARRALAARVHPLFETRGPPGTHDVAALGEALDALLEPGEVELPRFDKGRDDRGPSLRVRGPFDLVVLEGWCVGARPGVAASLASPVNALEAGEDADGRWRGAIEAALAGPYASLWRRLDAIVFLAVPGLDAVRCWRLQQESERPPALRLDARAVDRFVAHYERITLRMLAEMPARADWTIRLGEDHGVAAVERGGARGAAR